MAVNETTLLLEGLFLLFGGAVLVGELFSRIGQPPLVGQLLVGVVLGPTILAHLLGLTTITSSLSSLQTLATFFVLLMAGLAVSPDQIRATGRGAAVLGISIFLIPFLVGTEVVRALYPGMSTFETLFVSLTISITALPVLGIMLREFGISEGRFGAFLMNTALVNELCAVTTFAVLLNVYNNPHSTTMAVFSSIVTVVAFLLSILAVYYVVRTLRRRKLWDRLVDRFRATWKSREAGFAILMVAAIGAALYSQLLGLTYVIGAFYAGLLITPETAGRRQHRSISFVFDAITWGFFIPLFFAIVGFDTDFRLIFTAPVPILAFVGLVTFAFLAKVLVGTGVARALRWPASESISAGFLVSSRGAVELAMAVILLGDGIFSTQVYTIVAGVGLLTTAFSPIGARPFVRSLAKEPPLVEEGAANGGAAPPIAPRRLYTDRE